MARTKKGRWLTEHSLRSGIREQYASETKTVELYWDRKTRLFVVESWRPTYGEYKFVTIFDSLAEARELFRSLVKNDRQPKKGASQ